MLTQETNKRILERAGRLFGALFFRVGPTVLEPKKTLCVELAASMLLDAARGFFGAVLHESIRRMHDGYRRNHRQENIKRVTHC